MLDFTVEDWSADEVARRRATDPTLDDRSGAYVDEDGSVIPASEVATPELGAELWSRSEAWVEPAAR